MKRIIKTSTSFTGKAENGESKIYVFATFSDGTVEKVELSRIVFKSGESKIYVFATFSDGTVEKVELSRIVFKSGGAELKN